MNRGFMAQVNLKQRLERSERVKTKIVEAKRKVSALRRKMKITNDLKKAEDLKKKLRESL